MNSEGRNLLDLIFKDKKKKRYECTHSHAITNKYKLTCRTMGFITFKKVSYVSP